MPRCGKCGLEFSPFDNEETCEDCFMTKKIDGVWMYNETTSAARALAVQAMIACNRNPDDFRTRDEVIIQISGMLEQMLDEATNEE